LDTGDRCEECADVDKVRSKERSAMTDKELAKIARLATRRVNARLKASGTKPNSLSDRALTKLLMDELQRRTDSKRIA
jgi:hypothetical protein